MGYALIILFQSKTRELFAEYPRGKLVWLRRPFDAISLNFCFANTDFRLVLIFGEAIVTIFAP